MKIYLFLPDFRGLVKGTFFVTETHHNHSVFYYETPDKIYFYKPVESVVYCVEVIKKQLPEGIKISELKQEFKAVEVPKEIMPSKQMKFEVLEQVE